MELKRIASLNSLYVLIIFLVVFGLSSYSISSNRQLGMMGGMAEEYINMGWSLYETGRFVPDPSVPSVFRPPVYPLFIAAALEVWGGDRYRHVTDLKAKREAVSASTFVVFFAQAILLALSACLLFLILAGRVSAHTALISALLFGCNVYLVILTGFLHYEILHIFLTLLSLYVLCRALADSQVSIPLLALSGALWGVTTLLRPMTLILPVFLFFALLFLFRRRWRYIVGNTLLFTFGMLIVIVPWTVRNYSLTGRVIPVNAQGGIAVWASTVAPMERSPNHYRWWGVWYGFAEPVYNRITGATEYDKAVYLRNVLALEDEYKKEKWQNLRRQPSVYIRNVGNNLLTFTTDINSVLVKIFQAIQIPDMRFNKDWLEPGNRQDFYPAGVTAFFACFVGFLSLAALAGVVAGFRKKDPAVITALMAFSCFCTAHALSYMDFLYYYIKVPFLFLFAAYFVHEAAKYRITVLQKQITAASLISISMVVGTVYLAIQVL